MNVTGFTRIFSGYQDMASKIYEGQNPLLLILSVGVLSAAAEEIVFRGMIYRRAKDFWGPAGASQHHVCCSVHITAM